MADRFGRTPAQINADMATIARLSGYDQADPSNYSDALRQNAARLGMTPPEYVSWSRSQGSIQAAPAGPQLRERAWQGAARREGTQFADRVVGRPYRAEGGSLSLLDFAGGGALDLVDAVSRGRDASLGDAAMAALGAAETAGAPLALSGARKAMAGAPADASDFGRGWADYFHWSKSPTEFDRFSQESAIGATSILGPHIGTAQAAADRAAGHVGTVGHRMELKADVSKPFLNPATGEPWGEEALNNFISGLADHHGINRTDAAVLLRQRLAENGYTNVPYINDVEDPGSISQIMLTDRPKGSDAVLRKRSAAFDPRNRTSQSLSASVGGLGLLTALTQQQEQ